MAQNDDEVEGCGVVSLSGVGCGDVVGWRWRPG